MSAEIFLTVQVLVYGLLGVTNLLFTKKRLLYVFGSNYEITSLDIFWQRDIGIFQIGLATLALYSLLDNTLDMKSAFITLGLVWTLGALFLSTTALFNRSLDHITSKRAGLAIASVSAVFALLNWYFFF